VDVACKLAAQYRVIERREMLDEVGAQRISIPPCPLLQPVHRAVRAFPGAVGIAVRNKARLEGGLDEVAQRMMHDAVAERRGAALR